MESAPLSGPGEITRLLRRLADGDGEAFDRLLPLVYSSLKEVSRRELRRRSGATLSTTELVHEAYFKLVRTAEPEWEEREHFLAVAARAMRQVLVDDARRRSAQKREGRHVTLTARHVRFEVRFDEILALDEALDRLDALSERLRVVVELRFFGGMQEREIAQLLGVSARTVERDWAKARLFLHRELYPDTATG